MKFNQARTLIKAISNNHVSSAIIKPSKRLKHFQNIFHQEILNTNEPQNKRSFINANKHDYLLTMYDNSTVFSFFQRGTFTWD